MKKYFAILISLMFYNFSISNTLEKKVNNLLKQMTLKEKIGQMIQVDHNAIKNNYDNIIKYNIGSILWGGDSEIEDLSANGWKQKYDELQSYSLKQKLKIPIIFGIDAVHGHNNVVGSVIFPHNISFGAANNPDLTFESAKIISKEIKSTGIHWTFAPCVAVARNEKWGRTYESFGEDPLLVKNLTKNFVKGIQGEKLSDKNSTLATIKHFLGDGGSTNGKDQGNIECDEKNLREFHLQGYIEAINSGAKSIMISYNSWNGIKNHGNKFLITDLLKNELKFSGFTVSDWAAIDQLDTNYKKCISISINAGLDLIMIPNGVGQKNNYIDFATYLEELVKEKKISIKRINDAVSRILKVKYELGLFDDRFCSNNLISEFGSVEHRNIARQVVRESIVLLKNENKILPISKNIKNIHVAGIGAENVGMQCGGWTIDWQGKSGREISGGTSILTAIKNSVSKDTKVSYSLDGSGADSNDLAILVVGEEPYAEFIGDKENLVLSKSDSLLIENMKSKNIPFVVLLITGRPLIVNQEIEKSKAFMVVWLPGTEANGITDVLFGDYSPKGKLPHTWPKSLDQIPINVGDKNYDPLFPFGYGLTY